jgi:hypothetical protein
MALTVSERGLIAAYILRFEHWELLHFHFLLRFGKLHDTTDEHSFGFSRY